MGTRRLSFDTPVTPVIVAAASGPEPLEIEVPRGESHFHIPQPEFPEQHYVFHLHHPESRVLITGLVEAKDQETPYLTTRVVHHAPSTTAETLIRTLSSGQAAPRYEGLIRIEPDAHSSESYLNHHALLLDTTAKSWTLPSLEILANDVRCSHAATVRTITELDLFYPRSRGILREEARNMAIEAFISDVKPSHGE